MSSCKLCLVLAAVLVAGCASAPEQTAGRLGQTPERQDSAAPVVAEGEAPVVGLEEVALDPGSVVVCREMLKQGSNVIVARCMSRNDWKRYQRIESLEAQRIVRTLQGSAYR